MYPTQYQVKGSYLGKDELAKLLVNLNVRMVFEGFLCGPTDTICAHFIFVGSEFWFQIFAVSAGCLSGMYRIIGDPYNEDPTSGGTFDSICLLLALVLSMKFKPKLLQLVLFAGFFAGLEVDLPCVSGEIGLFAAVWPVVPPW